jgi:uncharacterized protein
MKTSLRALLTAVALASAAAFAQAPKGLQVPGGGIQATPAGTIPWELLQQAKTVQKADKKFGPEFTPEIRSLDKQNVKIYGFMMPLDQSRLQKRFLLASFPPHCAFCMPGGPESMIEVIADKPVEFTYEPIVVAGRMAVLENDIVYYRLTGASAVQP